MAKKPARQKKHKSSTAGCFANNCHEGHRSEYLAHYFFSGLGTSVPVPVPEDAGFDLHCTLTEVIGKRAWPRQLYSVQVKSTDESWVIEGEDSVRWLFEQSTAIFLCIVEKKAGRIRVYHTLPRHSLRSLPPRPKRIEFLIEDRNDGDAMHWSNGRTVSLSAPILSFGIDKLLDDEFRELAKRVISEFIFVDELNSHVGRRGISFAFMPTRYETNDGFLQSGTIGHGESQSREELSSAISNVGAILSVIAGSLSTFDDKGTAARIWLLLLRLGIPPSLFTLFELAELSRHLNFPLTDAASYFEGLKRIDTVIEDMVPAEWRRELSNDGLGIAATPINFQVNRPAATPTLP